MSGSVRGAPGNRRSYRDHGSAGSLGESGGVVTMGVPTMTIGVHDQHQPMSG